MFGAGAGRIGDYTRCSFRSSGQGSFLGGEWTRPAVGTPGQLEYVDEIRLESIVRANDLAAVISALRAAHPYEEPAFDIYPLKAEPLRGIGRYGRLSHPVALAKLARKLKKATQAEGAQIIGTADRLIHRAIIVVGAAGSLPFRIPLLPNDVIVTGEIRHHDALAIDRCGCTAIALGHWASERPVLEPLAERLSAALPGVTYIISTADQDPFRTI